MPLGQLLRVYIDGVPLDLASRLLPLRTRLRFGLLSHIHLHARAQTRHADVALSTAEAMWSAYLSGHPGLVSGISAAPSMHIAISMWIFLVARDLAPKAVPIAAAYLAFICIASVQLGWHYVTDGIAAVVGMVAIWWVAGL